MTLAIIRSLRRTQRAYRNAFEDCQRRRVQRVTRWTAAGCLIRHGMGQDELSECMELQKAIDHETGYERAANAVLLAERELLQAARAFCNSKHVREAATEAGISLEDLHFAFCCGSAIPKGKGRSELIDLCLKL